MRKTVYLCTSLIFLGLAAYMYCPLPDDMDQPWVQFLWVIPGRSVVEVCRVSTYFGMMDFFNCSRKIASLVEKNPPDLSDKDLKVKDTTFDGVPVRLYQPRDVSPEGHPGVIYLHGGGWTLMNVKIYDRKTRDIAIRLNAVVASVDYRLAPEHPFPIPFQDCLNATKYFLRNVESLNVNSKRIVLEGDSAGGNMAMAVAMALADTKQGEKLPQLRMLAMIYPVLQMADFNMASHLELDGGPYLLTRSTLIFMCLNYAFGNDKLLNIFLTNNQTCNSHVKYSLEKNLYGEPLKQSSCVSTIPDDVAKTITNKYVSPLLAADEDLLRLPETFVMTAQYDPLRDEGFYLVDRMQKLDRPVTHSHWRGVQHGFFSTHSVIDKTKISFNEFIRFIRDRV